MKALSQMKSSRTFPSRARFLPLVAAAAILSACGGGSSADNQSAIPPNAAALAWDAVPAPNVAGYRIYYGTAPGTYQQAMGAGINVGNVTNFTVGGLASGRRFYFAATAVDNSNNESNFSNEVFKDIP